MREKTLCTRVGHFTVWYHGFGPGGRYAVRCDYVPGPVIRYFMSYEHAVSFAQAQYRVWQLQQKAEAAGEGAGDG